MANLRELRTRIASVRSTRKITSAMKMVAAARLRQAQEAVNEAGYYSASLGRIMLRLGKLIAWWRDKDAQAGLEPRYDMPDLIKGHGKDVNHLLVVFASSRGLCGGFNINIIKKTIQFIRHLESQGRTVKLICVGSKAAEMLRAECGDKIVYTFNAKVSAADQRADAEIMASHVVDLFKKGTIDACSVIYNHFHSAISQEVRVRPIVPLQAAHILQPFTGENPWGFLVDGSEGNTFHLQRPSASKAGTVGKGTGITGGNRSSAAKKSAALQAQYRPAQVRKALGSEEDEAAEQHDPLEYDFEPENPKEMLDALLPDVLATLIYVASLESAASENGARMTAMDNATNNAGDIIDDLTLMYNRTRQAMITKELTEIISGAEAL